MSNILKVTTPTVGYDNTVNNKPTPSQQAEDLSIKNPVEANKVGRADGRAESNSNDGGRGIAYDSNFGTFIQSLRDLPKLNEIMSKMIFSGMGNLVESGISKGTAAEIQAFFQMLEMSPEKMTEFLTTHYMEEAENICDRVIMINKGKIIKTGTPEEIKKDTNSTNLRDAFFTMIGGVSNEE